MGLSFLLGMKRTWRRRNRRKESENWVAPEIPVELLMEILARLPAKSVMRFKCTSKFMSSIFRSTYFCNRFMMLPTMGPLDHLRLYMCLLDRGNYSKSLLLSSAPTTCSPSSLAFDQDLTIPAMGGFFLSVGRGLLCFTVFEKARIYNPSTRQLVILPAVEESNILAEEDRYNIGYFLCYDYVNDQHKVVCTIEVISEDMQKSWARSELWVFVVEAGGSWKRLAEDFQPLFSDPLQLIIKGVLYYLAWTDPYSCVLVSFDISSEELEMLQVPRKAGDVLSRLDKWVTQIEYGGKVTVFDFTYLKEKGEVDLWVVEDWRKKEWSMKTLVLQTCHMHLLTDNRLKPQGRTLKDKVVLVPMRLVSPFYFLCYDIQSNHLQKVEIKGIPDRWFSKRAATKYFDIEFMESSESIQYLKLDT